MEKNTFPASQKTLRRWMEGAFTDLDPDVVLTELEEFWRDFYKVRIEGF